MSSQRFRIRCAEPGCGDRIACKEEKCKYILENPIFVLDMENMVSLNHKIRERLVVDEDSKEPPRCDCIVARRDAHGMLVFTTVELKGSLSWLADMQNSEKPNILDNFSEKIARKHVRCFLLLVHLAGDTRFYRVECETLVRAPAALYPILDKLILKIKEKIRKELFRIKSKLKYLEIKCSNWNERIIEPCH